MKFIKLFEEFARSGYESNVMNNLVKKYEKWERGVIKAWGSIFYMDYHKMPTGGKTQPFNQLKRDFVELFNTPLGTDEFEELDDWIQEYGKRGGVPLFNKTIMNKIFSDIAKKTPAPFDFTVYRTSVKEEGGVNSYTLNKGAYLDCLGNCIERAYLIKKGTPVIFAGADADNGEIIWMPTKADLTKYRIS